MRSFGRGRLAAVPVRRGGGTANGASEGNDVVPAAINTYFLVVAELGKDAVVIGEGYDRMHDFPRARSGLIGWQPLLEHFGT